MSFVKSILQQWRERNNKKDVRSTGIDSSLLQIPGEDLAEQHLVEALACQINDMVASGCPISETNVDEVYDRLSAALSNFRRESRNFARNELSEQWREEENRRISEIKSLQEQLASSKLQYDDLQKRHLSVERLRQTLSDRIHILEDRLITTQKEYERDIEEKLRQINKIKAYSQGLISEDEEEDAEVTEIKDYASKEPKVFDCDTVGDIGDAAVIVKHRYASLYRKLNKAQDTVQNLRKEIRVITKRDSRHRERIKILQGNIQEMRRELRQVVSELEKIRSKTDKKATPALSETGERKVHEKYPMGFASSFFSDEDM